MNDQPMTIPLANELKSSPRERDAWKNDNARFLIEPPSAFTRFYPDTTIAPIFKKRSDIIIYII